jgi:hypothetical protein
MDAVHEDICGCKRDGAEGILYGGEIWCELIVMFSLSWVGTDLRQITRVTIPPPVRGGRTAFVEFGDEEAMKAGLEKHAEVAHSICFYAIHVSLNFI